MKDVIILVLGAALVTFLLTCQKRPAVRENYWGLPNRTVRRDQVVVQNNVAYGIQPSPLTAAAATEAGMIAAKRHPSSAGGFDSSQHPLSFQGHVRENYVAKTANTISNCREINTFQNAASDGYVRSSSENEPVAVYDRLIYANQRSRLAGLGDPIRGDLPIAPINDGWFRPSVAPNVDLRQGAIHVIAGETNGTSNDLRALQLEHSAKTSLSNQNISHGSRSADIVITGFP